LFDFFFFFFSSRRRHTRFSRDWSSDVCSSDLNMAILTSVFPPQERGKAIGINSASVYVGLSLGPVLGGFLNHRFGWHSIFFFCEIGRASCRERVVFLVGVVTVIESSGILTKNL